jgi:hypothetical protein
MNKLYLYVFLTEVDKRNAHLFLQYFYPNNPI